MTTTKFQFSFGQSLIWALCLVWLFPAVGSAQEVINNFDSVITVNADSSFEVVEEITYNFGRAERRGIYRDIPLTHPQPASKWYKQRVIEVEVDEVLRNGESEPFILERSNESLRIKIGEAGTSISGPHVYTISYTVDGAISYYDNDSPELFWDAVGTNWQPLIQTATISIIDPDGITLVDRACYQGQEGSARSCDSISATTSMVTFTASQLIPGEGVTVAQSLDRRSVEERIIEYIPQYFILVPVLIFIVLVLALLLYSIKTRHKTSLPVVAQYDPYPDMLPMYTGVILDGRLDAHDITAGLLYPAEQGFLSIKKTDRKVLYFFEVDDYEITLKKEITNAPTHFHETILELLFDGNAPGETVALSEIQKDSSRQRQNAKKLRELKTAVAKDVEEKGFYENLFKWQYILWFVIFLVIATATGAYYLGEESVVLIIVGCVIGAGMFGLVYRRRTRLGYEALNHLKGFEDFLATTDKDRFSFHNGPDKSPETFMKYLPYAVAFGVEKEWSKVFDDITIPSPEWYDSGSLSSFNAAALTSDLGAFSTAFASSSGSTGSSGGGSVGGGAGGGGGGSW